MAGDRFTELHWFDFVCGAVDAWSVSTMPRNKISAGTGRTVTDSVKNLNWPVASRFTGLAVADAVDGA